MTDLETMKMGPLTITRMGYGAMQLAGKGVFGPPKDRDTAIAVARKAVDLGVRHIDTSDFYGPHVTNQILKEALHPYSDDLVLVTKVGAKRDDKGAWIHDLSPEFLVSSVHDNLRNLGLEAIDVVNLRMENTTESAVEAFGALAELQTQSLVKHIGLSNAGLSQLRDVQEIAPVVTIQNQYNVALREDEELLNICAAEGIAYVPFFPLGGFSPLQSDTLEHVAKELESSPQQVALAWLLQHSPAIGVIPGTSSLGHLQENFDAASLELPADAIERLDGIATQK